MARRVLRLNALSRARAPTAGGQRSLRPPAGPAAIPARLLAGAGAAHPTSGRGGARRGRRRFT